MRTDRFEPLIDATSFPGPLSRAFEALVGLSVGDTFGDGYFVGSNTVESIIRKRIEMAAPWRYTDDTEMALSVFHVLKRCGEINQDALAESFTRRYNQSRGYGPAMHRLFRRIAAGEGWEAVAGEQFNGQGSFGNGAAMRVAPIGPYFADDLERVKQEATLSAVVTHAHPEGVAGAVAVAVAAAWAWRVREEEPVSARGFIDRIREFTPDSVVREKLRHARDLPNECSVELAVAALGNGTEVSAQDTVPFAIWAAARHLTDFEEALWTTVSGLGDRDTTCAIVGGIVAAHVGINGIPRRWFSAREPLPVWPFA